jgi:hypothetical protein
LVGLSTGLVMTLTSTHFNGNIGGKLMTLSSTKSSFSSSFNQTSILPRSLGTWFGRCFS